MFWSISRTALLNGDMGVFGLVVEVHMPDPPVATNLMRDLNTCDADFAVLLSCGTIRKAYAKLYVFLKRA